MADPIQSQHEVVMAAIHSKLDALIDYFRMRSKGIEPPDFDGAHLDWNPDPEEPTLVSVADQLQAYDEAEMGLSTAAGNQIDDMLEINKALDSEENDGDESAIKHSFVDADTTRERIAIKHELESFPIHESVEKIDGDEPNAEKDDNGGGVLPFTDLESNLGSEGEGTVTRSANGLLNKAWVEEVTSSMKVDLSQNVFDDVAHLLFDEMTKAIQFVVPGVDRGMISDQNNYSSILVNVEQYLTDLHLLSKENLLYASLVECKGVDYLTAIEVMFYFDPGGCYLSQIGCELFEFESKHEDNCLEINIDDALVKAKEYCVKAFDEQLETNRISLRPVCSFEACKNIVNLTYPSFVEFKNVILSTVIDVQFYFDPGGIYVTCLSKGVVSPLISKALRTYVDGIKGVLLLIRHPISFIDAREKHYVIGSIYFLWSDRDNYIGWGRSVRVPGLYIILEECKDSLHYVLSICPETELYGICSIILSLSNGMIRAKPVGSLRKCKIARSLTYNDVVFSFDPGGSPYILRTGKWSGLFYSNQGRLIEYTAITLFGWSLSYWFSRRVRPPSGNVCVCVVYCCFHVACGLVLQFRFEVLLVFFPFQTSVLNAKYMGHWLDLFINVALDDKRGKTSIQGPDLCNSLKHVKWINMALDFDVVGLFWMRRCNSSRIEEMRDPLEYLLGKDESKCFMIMLYSHHSSSECKYLANVQHDMLTVCVAKLIDNKHSLRHALFSDDKVKDLSRISFSKFPKGLDHVDSLILKYVIVKLCQVKLVWLLLFDKGANEDTVKAIDGTVFKCFLTIGRVCYATFCLLIHVELAWPVVTLVDSKGNRTFVVLTLVECAEEDRKHYNVLVNPYDLAYTRVLQVHLYKTCLFIKLAHFTANQAILEDFCYSTGTTISKNFVWDPGVFHLTTLRTRRLLRRRICHVPRLKFRKMTEDA